MNAKFLVDRNETGENFWSGLKHLSMSTPGAGQLLNWPVPQLKVIEAKPLGLRVTLAMTKEKDSINPSNAEATSVQSTRTQRFLKTI